MEIRNPHAFYPYVSLSQCFGLYSSFLLLFQLRSGDTEGERKSGLGYIDWFIQEGRVDIRDLNFNQHAYRVQDSRPHTHFPVLQNAVFPLKLHVFAGNSRKW